MKSPKLFFRTERPSNQGLIRRFIPWTGLAILSLVIAACNSDSGEGFQKGIGTQTSGPTATGAGSGTSSPVIKSQDSEDELPRGWIRLRFEGFDYVCDEVSFGEADCVRTFGPVPTFIGKPDQYCSNVNSSFPDCSELWYPSELEDFTFLQVGPYDYVCEDSFSGFAYGDAECFRYSGGDPNSAMGAFPDLYCSDSFSAVPSCDEDYFPSELEDLEFVTIEGDDYVCENTFGGLECFEWRGFGSPQDAIGFRPDFYCNDWGECARDDFP